MYKEPTFHELLEHINSGNKERKANCSVGFFVTEYTKDDDVDNSVGKDVDSFQVKKPIVNIMSFMENNSLYYEVSFHFNSLNDSDYKQMWRFLCRFADRAKREATILQDGGELSKITGLSVSILPELYRGKYFVYINLPFADTLSCSENAYDKTAKISFYCTGESLGGLVSDDDIVDRRSIEREVEGELMAEMAANNQES